MHGIRFEGVAIPAGRHTSPFKNSRRSNSLMAGGENVSSVFDLEPTVQDTDDKPVVQAEAPKQTKARSKDSKAAVSERKKDHQKQISELKASHKNDLQLMKKKHQMEIQELQKRLKDHESRSKEELRKSEKQYNTQLEQIRKENKENSTAMYKEIKDFLGAQISEMREANESAIRNDNHEYFEGLRQSMESVFTDELQKKTAELEQMKVFSEAQANKLVQDTHEKNQRIDFLEEKIKEIAQKLPEEAQHELYEELGFELPKVLEELDEPKHKKKKKGFFGRLGV
jgi:hypothetical protein